MKPGIKRTDTSWFDNVDPKAVFLIITQLIPGVSEENEEDFIAKWNHSEKFIRWTVGARQAVGFSRENYDDMNNKRHLPMMHLVARDGDDLVLDAQIEEVNMRLCDLLRELSLLEPCA